jgi:cytochrome b pre-mRNA-processing protein 3
MSLLQRLLGTQPDPRETMRPLWHRVVEISREKHWYASEGVADTISGRFDMITLVLAMVLLRLDGEPDTGAPSALLTELFVEDMDGQMRQSGVGDVVVGKHIGKLVSVLGGRIGALRKGLASTDDTLLGEALTRNVTLIDGATPAELAPAIRALHARLAATPVTEVLAGNIA